VGALAALGMTPSSPTATTAAPTAAPVAMAPSTQPLTLPGLTPLAVQNPALAQPTPDGSTISPLALAAYGISP
jgi:hypothetical protein